MPNHTALLFSDVILLTRLMLSPQCIAHFLKLVMCLKSMPAYLCCCHASAYHGVWCISTSDFQRCVDIHVALVLQLSYNTSADFKCGEPYVKPYCMCTCGFCPAPKRESEADCMWPELQTVFLILTVTSVRHSLHMMQ